MKLNLSGCKWVKLSFTQRSNYDVIKKYTEY